MLSATTCTRIPLRLQKGEGPIAVIVAPTRELAEQIHKEAREGAALLVHA